MTEENHVVVRRHNCLAVLFGMRQHLFVEGSPRRRLVDLVAYMARVESKFPQGPGHLRRKELVEEQPNPGAP